MITVLTVRGNGEKLNDNMLKRVTDQLPKDRFTRVDVDYPASLGPAGGRPFAPSEMESVNVGCDVISRAVDYATGPVVLLGYSLGGVVATHWLDRNPDRAKVVMAGCLANPCRTEGVSYGRPSSGEGIFGAPVRRDKRLWAEIASPNDVITSMPLNSPLRLGSDLIQEMSLADPAGWALDVLAKLPDVQRRLVSANWFRWLDPRFRDSFVVAAQMLNAYATGGAHTDAYFRKDWRDWQGKPVSGVDLLARCVKGVRSE